MTPEQLAQILLQIPPYEPAAVQLLKARRDETGDMFPRPGENRAQIVRATVEMKRIADDTTAMETKLRGLPPVALTDPNAESVVGGYSL
jgi:hypothetical protein